MKYFLILSAFALTACVGPEKPAVLPEGTPSTSVSTKAPLRAGFQDTAAYRTAWQQCGGKGWQVWPEGWANGLQTFSCIKID